VVSICRESVHYPAELLYLLEVCPQIYTETRLLVFSVVGLSGHCMSIEKFLSQGVLTADQKCAIAKVNYRMSSLSILYLLDVVNLYDPLPYSNFKSCLQDLLRLQGLRKTFITTVLDEHGVQMGQVEIQKKDRQIIKDTGLNVEVDLDFDFEQT
jgi:hypothetical protein